MTRRRATLHAVVLGAIGSLAFAPFAMADEPAAKPKAEAATAAKPAAQPAKKKSDKQVVPIAVPKKGTAKPKAAKGRTAKGKAKPLIAPPGLLSRPPAVVPATRPGMAKLNLNRAKIEDLQRLRGVGVVWAPRILAGKPYRTWGDLSRTGIPFTVILALSRETELGPR